MLMARAIQLFMPGKPQIWYLILPGKMIMRQYGVQGAGGHKKINRTNLTKEYAEKHFLDKVVQQQFKLLRFRTEFPGTFLSTAVL